MRCPKCGFISFDHMETCLKCKKDITGSAGVEGTTYHAAAPSFLRVPEKNVPEQDEDFAEDQGISFEQDEGFAEDDYDFSDPDLDVLGSDNDEDAATLTFGDSDSEDFLLEADDDDEEGFEFDLDEDDLDFTEDEATAAPALNVPDELADITDLAPPVDKSPAASDIAGMNLSLDDDMDQDEDLDLDGLDLDLGLNSTEELDDTDLSLSLDDIDLSAGDIIEESSDLDDLNMDLDLDSLEAPPAEAKEDSSGSLGGISLSLD